MAAGKRNWFPHIFTLVGRLGAGPPNETGSDNARDVDGDESDAPVNALILSAILSTLYILLGDFRALLLFNGLGEYSFFFITVVGVVILRYREPNLHRPYKPSILVPTIFALVSGFVVARGSIFAPTQAGVLVILWTLGLGLYKGWVAP